MFFVYILKSKSTGQFYTGQSAGIAKRLEQHNTGWNRSTKNRGPWMIVHQEIFATRAEAMRREKELKTGKGREELKRILKSKSSP